ncbi:beta-ketoacyl-[acyl-carrier-protein] synthase family protein [Desulfobacterales bacterium HSG17]|nr:beta-ketoacyl-[acyl-carrier-protein] synthase family protein [Desulfobacterales bacterium HSG17]
MSLKKAVIAGYDAISPLGTDMEIQWKNAVLGKSGIKELTRFPFDNDFPVRIAGQVDEIDTSIYPFLSPRALALWPSPIFKYAMLTVHRALEKSKIEIDSKLAPRVAITFSSAVGGQGVLLNADRRMISEKKLPPPLANPNSCINMVGGKISILTGATGPIFASITACATGLTSLITGAMILEQGRADVAICGAVDFALVEPIVAGFATMNGAYSHKPGINESPKQASRPFSSNRRGFVISEGSGAVILTTKEFAKAHGLTQEIELAGWSMTSDARHFVAPNYETVKRCIAESISDAGISPDDIDAVNAHATSTKIGDKVEYDALKAIFKDNLPPVSANKSMTGHAMGASSAIESIFAVTGMLNNILLPTINYTPDPKMEPGMELDCVSEGARKLDQEFVLKNAFGFGGCNSCVIFRRIK